MSSKHKRQAQSLGGRIPGLIIPVVLTEDGALGIQLEKETVKKSAIVSCVVAGSQAWRAGLQHGDVLCFGGSNGQEEISYDMFLELEASNERPLYFEARRAPASKAPRTGRTTGSARDAVLAAAERRDRDHRRKIKSIRRESKAHLPKLLSTAEKLKLERERNDRLQEMKNKPLSAATQQAIKRAKSAEARSSLELGYNPYEVRELTSGQARNAVTVTAHGTIQAVSATPRASTHGTIQAVLATPRAAAVVYGPPPSKDFQSAFEALVTSGTDHERILESLSILRKLIINATTKADGKFHRVRLTHPKIKAAVAEVSGGADILLETGFVLQTDENNETIFQYLGNKPQWLPSALDQMKRYGQACAGSV